MKRIPFRRKLKQKTDYYLRLKLIKSGKPRFVIRKSLKNIEIQLIEYSPDGDLIKGNASSKELKSYGWKWATGNLPSAYLTGFLAALKAKKKGITEAIVDIGNYPSTKSSKLYSAVKGALDAGLIIPYNKEILPSKERIEGKHIVDYAKTLSEEDKKKKFKEDPSSLPEGFIKIKEKIEKELK